MKSVHNISRYCFGLILCLAIGNVLAAGRVQTKPTEKQLVDLLYPQESSLTATGRQLTFKVWPKFTGRYIVVSYREDSSLTSKVDYREPLPVEIAVVQYTGSVPSVISRKTFFYQDGNFLAKVRIDTANYQISDTAVAFGLRTYDHNGGSGFIHDYESLDLFTVTSSGISHIAGNLTVGSKGLFPSSDEYNYCPAANLCELGWNHDIEKTLVVVTRNKTNGYYDLMVKTITTGASGRNGQSEKSVRWKKHIAAPRIFRWDGQKYQAK